MRTLEKFALLPVSNLANMFNISFTEFRKHIAKSKEAYHILQNARNYTLYQAIEDLKSSMAMLQEAGLSLEDIKRKNPKLFETWKSIEDGKIVAKGTRAETLLHKFMVLNPEHPLSVFVQEHGTNFDFDEEDAIIRINGAKKPKEEESKK